jgi:hypothetical protein
MKIQIKTLTIQKAMDISDAKSCPHCLREIADALERQKKNVFRVDGDWHVFSERSKAAHLAKRLS